jgi:hypothetical protein
MHVAVVHDRAEQRTCHFDHGQVQFACLMSMRNTCNKCAFAVFVRRLSAHMRAFAVFGGAQRRTCAALPFLQGSAELTQTFALGNVRFFHVCFIFLNP